MMNMHASLRKLPIGIQSFEKLRSEGYLYVDKTAWVYKLAQDGVPSFLSRPRRFGKSLLLSTLEAYFQGKKELFHGLAIEQLEQHWYEYPVLHLDLNAEKYDSRENLEQMLGDYILRTYHWSPTRSDAWTVLGTMSCSVDFLKGTAGLNVVFRKNNRTMLSEGLPTRYVQKNCNVTARLNGRIGQALNWQYRLNYGWNGLNIADLLRQRLNSWEHVASLTASLGKRWNLQATGEYYRNEVSPGQMKDMLLADGKLSYSLNSRLELSATVSNLFNKKSYAYTLYSDLSSVSYSRMIRGREFFVSVYLKR